MRRVRATRGLHHLEAGSSDPADTGRSIRWRPGLQTRRTRDAPFAGGRVFRPGGHGTPHSLEAGSSDPARPEARLRLQQFVVCARRRARAAGPTRPLRDRLVHQGPARPEGRLSDLPDHDGQEVPPGDDDRQPQLPRLELRQGDVPGHGARDGLRFRRGGPLLGPAPGTGRESRRHLHEDHGDVPGRSRQETRGHADGCRDGGAPAPGGPQYPCPGRHEGGRLPDRGTDQDQPGHG